MVAELITLVLVLVFIIVVLVWRVIKLKGTIDSILFDKKGLSVRYGKMSEQFFPFLKDYPYEPGNFRFIGSPIDGVQFEKDKVVFIEFKTGNSSLSQKQKEIKDLVEKKRVEFGEITIK